MWWAGRWEDGDRQVWVGQMDRRGNGWIDGWMDSGVHKCKDRRVNEQTWGTLP